jgi:uncharacterized protein (DUF305 family)
VGNPTRCSPDSTPSCRRHELATGLDSDAKALAEQIILTQQSEVDALRGIASRL